MFKLRTSSGMRYTPMNHSLEGAKEITPADARNGGRNFWGFREKVGADFSFAIITLCAQPRQGHSSAGVFFSPRPWHTHTDENARIPYKLVTHPPRAVLKVGVCYLPCVKDGRNGIRAYEKRFFLQRANKCVFSLGVHSRHSAHLHRSTYASADDACAK